MMRGGPWSAAERRRILDYCQTDVDPIGALLERMLPGILARPNGLGQALLRGRYMAAIARMERTGVPIDFEMLQRLRMNWGTIKSDLIGAIDKDYGVYEGTTFKAGLFAGYLVDNGIDWPRTDDGPSTARPGHVPRHGQAVSATGAAERPSARAQRAAAGEAGCRFGRPEPDVAAARSAHPADATPPAIPSSSSGRACGCAGLIKPPEGRALAYVDWKSQEVYIAAQLSGDRALLDAVLSGDPYLAFAKMAGLAPPDATKQSHKAIRDLCKTCVLGTNYGMQAQSLAARTGLSVIEAQDLLQQAGARIPDVHRVGRARRRRRAA